MFNGITLALGIVCTEPIDPATLCRLRDLAAWLNTSPVIVGDARHAADFARLVAEFQQLARRAQACIPQAGGANGR